METRGHPGDIGINKCLFLFVFFSQISHFTTQSGMQITCGTLGLSTATVKLAGADGKEHVACSLGTGPVDSAYKAVNLIVKVTYIHTKLWLSLIYTDN